MTEVTNYKQLAQNVAVLLDKDDKPKKFQEEALDEMRQIFTLANESFKKKDFEKALTHYTFLVTHDPANSGFLVGLAECLYEIGNILDARIFFMFANKLDPQTFLAMRVASCCVEIHQHAMAKEWFQKVLDQGVEEVDAELINIAAAALEIYQKVNYE